MQWRRLTPRGNTPYNGLYDEAPAEMGTFLRLKVYERVRISLVGVYERVEKSVISFCKSAQNQLLTEKCYGFKKPRKRSGFVIYSYLKGSAFKAVKRDANF